ncbi:MAG TPA: hypothetical protein VE987_11520, partial [Polyangiaceae bacterium]|nr:hypothetical protein [Polyangiaceae bacterium]
MTSAGRLATAFAIVLIASCGGSTVSPGGAPGDAGNPSMDGGGSSSGGGDAGTDGDATADAPAEPPDDGPWPAKHYPIPQMVDFGGPVIASPKIVTVTFQGQPNRDNERAFDDMIGGSAWWSAALAGYGIGAGQGGIYADLP